MSPSLGRIQEIYMSEQMRIKEDALHAQYRKDARKILVSHKAEDLIPMLGLEEEG